MSFKDLNKIANKYDSLGKTKSADYIDNFIMRWASPDKEPTMEDLLAEEDFLATLDEDPLEGLSEEDAGIASHYMETGIVPSGPEVDSLEQDDLEDDELSTQELERLMKDLENNETPPISHSDLKEKDFLEYADSFEKSLERSDDMPFRNKREPIEASMKHELNKIADKLDKAGLTRVSDKLDAFNFRFAEDEKKDDDTSEEVELDMQGVSGEPVAEVLEISSVSPDRVKFEEELANEDDVDAESIKMLEEIMGFISAVADGAFETIEEAKTAAEDLLNKYSEDEDSINIGFGEELKEEIEHTHSPFFISKYKREMPEA